MKKLHLVIILVFLSFISFSLTTKAGNVDRITELERKLQERDKVILELIDRVENLEEKLGVKKYYEKSRKKTADISEKTEDNNKIQEEQFKETPGAVIVDEYNAERALMRSLTRQGGFLLLGGALEIEPGFSYARKEVSTPSLFTSDDQIFSGKLERNTDNFTAGLNVRLGLPLDSQLEIGLPYRWSNVETVNEIGFAPTNASSQSADASGDLKVGIAKTIFREGRLRPNLVGRITWDSKTGKFSDGDTYLGGGFNEFHLSLTAIKRQDPLAFIGGLSYEYTLEKDGFKPGQIISANFGNLIALSPETSIRFLISGTYQNESELLGRDIIGSDRTIANFVVGTSTLLAPRTLLNLSVAVGLTEDTSDFSISVSMPLRLKKRLF